jgi:subtilisin family serine protease
MQSEEKAMAHMRRVRTMACVLVAMTLMVSLLGGSAFAATADKRRKIIMFAGTPDQSVFNQLAGLGITALYNLSLIDALAVRLPLLPPSLLEDLVTQLLSELPGIQEVIDDVLTVIDPICPTSTVLPPAKEYRWGMQQIWADEAHLDWPDPSQTGAVTVAVLDTGIAASHSELIGRTVQGYNAIDETLPPSDGHGHGTHMAGIILAKQNDVGVVGVAGVEPKIKVAAVKVLDNDGSGYLSVVINGLQWVSNNDGIRLLNMSFGFSFSNPSDGTPLMRAIQSLSNANKIMVASAGNTCTARGASEDGGGDNCGPAASCSAPLTDTTAPAAYQSVIAVEATDYNGLTPAYSLSGDVRAPGGVLISGAPDKGRILSTNKGGGYGVGHGTSQAAAHVTGAIALALSLDSDLSLQEVRGLLGQNLNVQHMINALPQ